MLKKLINYCITNGAGGSRVASINWQPPRCVWQPPMQIGVAASSGDARSTATLPRALPHATHHMPQLCCCASIYVSISISTSIYVLPMATRCWQWHWTWHTLLDVAHTDTRTHTSTWSSRVSGREGERRETYPQCRLGCASGSNDARVIWQHPVNRISSSAGRQAVPGRGGRTVKPTLRATAACAELKSMQWKVRNLCAKCVAASDVCVSSVRRVSVTR